MNKVVLIFLSFIYSSFTARAEVSNREIMQCVYLTAKYNGITNPDHILADDALQVVQGGEGLVGGSYIVQEGYSLYRLCQSDIQRFSSGEDEVLAKLDTALAGMQYIVRKLEKIEESISSSSGNRLIPYPENSEQLLFASSHSTGSYGNFHENMKHLPWILGALLVLIVFIFIDKKYNIINNALSK